jgi:hypothetical protein
MADFYVESSTSEAYFLGVEDRAGRLEGDMQDVKSLLSRLEPMIIRIDATLTSTLPHLATRLEVAAVRSDVTKDISGLRLEMNQKLSDLPTKTYMWGILGVLIGAHGAGLAASAVLK